MEAPFVLPLCFSADYKDFLQIQTQKPSCIGPERLSTICTSDLIDFLGICFYLQSKACKFSIENLRHYHMACLNNWRQCIIFWYI
jgi:hypothetical protein